MLRTVVVLALIGGCANRTANRTSAGVAIASLGCDWAQTRHAAERHWVEGNPLLGRHPSTERVDTYFAIATAGFVVVQALLPERWRMPLSAITIGVQGETIISNAYVGTGVCGVGGM